MTVGAATIAAAAVLAAAGFTGYATGSVDRVADKVDTALPRSESPPPKEWKRVQRKRSAPPSPQPSFRSRVSTAPAGAAVEPEQESRFEHVRRERVAAEAARDAELRERVQAGETTAKPAVDDFRSRIERPKAKREKKSSKRPFERRVRAGDQ